MPDQASRASLLTTLGWACFLACSWTWCIGMFLPVLLVRDYGVWGFVVFAVPNVIGAAAMGWVLTRPGAGERLLERHAAATKAFSAVTVAFHAAFVGILFQDPIHAMASHASAIASPAFLLALPLAVAIVIALGWRALMLVVSGLVLAFSAFAGGTLLNSTPDAPPLPTPTQDPTELLWLAPVTCFGFALCPYLDRTFHLARQAQQPSGARVSFTIGFGAFFLAMILVTLLYAHWMIDDAAGPMGLGDWVYAHIFVQLFFTVVLHMMGVLLNGFDVQLDRSIGGRGAGRPPVGQKVCAITALVGGLFLGLVIPFVFDSPSRLSAGEILYRLFMACYGLLFPTYVWICMIPTRDGRHGVQGVAGRRKLNVWIATVVIAAPFFWMGFIERQEIWLAPGLLLVLLARLALPRGRGTSARAVQPQRDRPLACPDRRPLSMHARQAAKATKRK